MCERWVRALRSEKSRRRRFSNGALYAAGLCSSQSWGRSLDYVQFQRIFISPSARITRKNISRALLGRTGLLWYNPPSNLFIWGARTHQQRAATHYTQILSLLASFDFIIRFVNIYKIRGSSAAASPGWINESRLLPRSQSKLWLCASERLHTETTTYFRELVEKLPAVPFFEVFCVIGICVRDQRVSVTTACTFQPEGVFDISCVFYNWWCDAVGILFSFYSGCINREIYIFGRKLCF